jgi:ADP-ribose pyrophosphatase YjhB (NUDIX family)
MDLRVSLQKICSGYVKEDDVMTQQIIPCVGAAILDDQLRVLLVKHIPKKGGFWSDKYICPGGRLEFGETLDDGVRREVREETGLEIEIVTWIRPMERMIPSEDGTIQEHILYLDAVAKVKQGQFKPASDVGEGNWFSREDLLKIQDEIHEDTQMLLKEAGLVEWDG